MSFFGRSSGSSAPSGSTSSAGVLTPDQNAKKIEVMNQVRQELASAHLQELVNLTVLAFSILSIPNPIQRIVHSYQQKMTDKCYNTCTPSDREKLTSKDEGCLRNCQQRFLEAFDIVSRTYVARLGQERQAALSQNPLNSL